MYIVLIFTLIMLLLLNFTVTHDVLAPGGLYCGVLLAATLYGLIWFDSWELYDYGVKTYFIIVSGALVFSSAGWIIHFLFTKKSTKEGILVNTGTINVGKLQGSVIAISELATLFLAFEFYGGSLSTLSNSIINYRVAAVQKVVAMPSYLSFLLSFSLVVGYLCGYALVNNYLFCKKLSPFWLITFFFSIANSLLGGSRGGAVSIIFVVIGTFCILYGREHRRSLSAKQKKKIRRIILGLPIVGIAFFLQSASWIGRTINESPAYYFAIYLSAPLKNLDINIKAIDRGEIITGKAYTSINGLSLGNVGTIYTYEYIEGGLLEVWAISMLVGVMISVLYEIVRSKKIYSSKCYVVIVLYSYLYYCVAMIIFGTTLISSIFSFFFIKIVVGMFVLSIFFNIKFEGRYIKYGRRC